MIPLIKQGTPKELPITDLISKLKNGYTAVLSDSTNTEAISSRMKSSGMRDIYDAYLEMSENDDTMSDNEIELLKLSK